MDNIKTILAGLSLTMAVGMPAVASDELTMVVGTYTDLSTSDGMYVYRFNQRTGKSQLVGDVKAGNPSFLMMNHDANRVYAVSEYDDGRQGLGAFILNKKEGTMTPDHHYMLANDLGNDCIWRFQVNDGKEFLSNPVLAYQAPKGTGPRHLVFNSKGNVAYLIGELDGTVTVLGYNKGTLQELQRIQASKTRTLGSADIHLSPDGRFLYASHRLTDEGISVFAVDKKSGLLTKIDFQPTAAHPRNFAITPNGQFMLVACRDSHVIQVFKLNKKTGMMVDTKLDIKVGKPVCVQFAN